LCSDAKVNDAVWPYPEIDAIATAGIVVNQKGIRIVDEGRTGVHLANQLAAVKDAEKLYAVFDQTIWDGPGTSARIPANPLLERAGGTVLRANSVAELAQQMDVPSNVLEETIAAYNNAVHHQKLSDLSVTRSSIIKPFPLENLPLMAIPICPGITYTMDGIDIDQHAQVLDSNAKPIPGLFAAGATTGGIEGGKDSAYIGGLIKSGSFGLIAAERIASLEGKVVSIAKEPQIQSPSLKENVHETLNKTIQGLNRGAYGLDKFPILKNTIRYGKKIAIILAVIVFVISFLAFASFALGWKIAIATSLGLITLVIILGIVELIQLITEFLMPE
jgi:fumarate reductase flavoprotein subunit